MGVGLWTHPCVPLSRSSLLRTAFLLLLLISATWLLGLLAVNSDVLTFHYLFAIFSCLQVGGSQRDPAGPSAWPDLVGPWVACAASSLKCPNPEGLRGSKRSLVFQTQLPRACPGTPIPWSSCLVRTPSFAQPVQGPIMVHTQGFPES